MRGLHGKFFYGRAPEPRKPLLDEVFLDVEDDYVHLPFKVQAACKWALEHEFEYMLKCDDDTGVYVDRLGYEIFDRGPFDYAGRHQGQWASGGPGYWLSAKAMELIVAAKPGKEDWAEDRWVGSVLTDSKLVLVNLPGHKMTLGVPSRHPAVTFHADNLQDLYTAFKH